MEKVSQKEKESEDTLGLMIKIMHDSAEKDQEERANGKLLKYVFEIRNKNNEIRDVMCAYTESYYTDAEITSKVGLSGDEFTMRGPFPLAEGAITDSKINRWKEEQEKSVNDVLIVDEKIKQAQREEYKYIYLIYDYIFDVDRFVSFSKSNTAFKKDKIHKILSIGNSRRIKRLNLTNGEEKRYGERNPTDKI